MIRTRISDRGLMGAAGYLCTRLSSFGVYITIKRELGNQARFLIFIYVPLETFAEVLV